MDEDKNRILDAENTENENDADGDSVIESTNANEGMIIITKFKYINIYSSF